MLGLMGLSCRALVVGAIFRQAIPLMNLCPMIRIVHGLHMTLTLKFTQERSCALECESA